MNRLARLAAIAERPRRRVLGLMSGTSVDGVDAVAVEITGAGATARVELLAFRSFPYPEDLRERVFRLFRPEEARVEEICTLDFVLGELFAAAALRLLRESGLAPEDVDLVGTAGQTIWHSPDPELVEARAPWMEHPILTRATLAIGQSAVIAERTGIATIGDLRVRDVAAGGQGAPLIAYADWVLLRHPTLGRAVQNIGGIGNVTYLGAGCELDDVVAFDTGPGNMIIDALAEIATEGAETFDRDGRLAAAGRVRPDLVAEWMRDPYFARTPPKTTGREQFGVQFAQRARERFSDVPLVDLVASATALTAESIAMAYRRFLAPLGGVDECIVGGGGARNPSLLAMLRARLPGIEIVTHEERGIDSRAKEAIGIAVIANDSLCGLTTNAPRATGGRPTVLGKVSP